MKTKLTLYIDEKVLESAKSHAQKSGTSLSILVEDYLRNISGTKQNNIDIDPRVSKLMGIIKLESDFDYKKELSHAIARKYL